MEDEKTLTKKELIERTAKKAGFSQEKTATLLNSIIKTVKEAVKEGYNVPIIGLGEFVQTVRKARVASNPRTKETVTVPEHRDVYFKVSKLLKDEVR